ncbi:MAG TPA: NOL1/NOP2/sun family putative RNA methylase [Candidatus Peribacteraceae bacterium]|nr:NOL1/NOP2/sun family putative RNA methylase [Candidatus Peribacteraceae bacterium]
MSSTHPFDRYAAFTDLTALKDFSARPLRKSVRVNTLKMSVEDFKAYAQEKGWKLSPVPWTREGFFIEREDRSVALGRDLLHLIGCFYMQEAASMLPASLLNAQPGDVILDMSAAPGSKTTELGDHMQGRGVIVANDVQEKRLWTLKTAIHRSGVINTIVTKKVGQWFAKHMTETFDAVLCDAPCTAQGTARKDSDALKYCSMENIEKMARLQFQLLESAIHSAKVGGRIIYSTCTLTPEENEGLILQILDRFPDQVEVIDPRSLGIADDPSVFDQAIKDSIKVQQSLKNNFQFSTFNFPFLRLWPQTYDTEGFFSVVLQKKKPTKQPERMDIVRFQERELPRSKKESVEQQLHKHFGSGFMMKEDRLFERGEMLILSTTDVAQFKLPMQNYSLGIPFAKQLKDGRVILDHEAATLRGHLATTQRLDLTDDQLANILDAKDIDCPTDLKDRVLLFYNGHCIGLGLAKDGRLKNNLPRWMVRFG